MKVRDLVRELLAYDNQDEEVQAVWLPSGSGDCEYLAVAGTYAADNDGAQFIALEVNPA